MADDAPIEKAIEQVEAVTRGDARAPTVQGFFDEATFTASYVVSDPVTKRAAIIDSVLDFDQPSGRTWTTIRLPHSAQKRGGSSPSWAAVDTAPPAGSPV